MAHHVIPAGDRVEHALTEDCVCRPRRERTRRGDGSTGWAIVHSDGGRESHEGDDVDETASD